MIASLSKSLKTELYRKAVHLSSLWMPLFLYHAGKIPSLILFGMLLVMNLVIEYTAFRRTSHIGILFRKMFIRTLRHKEVSRGRFVPSGSVYVLAAALACSACFSPIVAATSMSIMLISDSCAALWGKFCGRFRFKNGKSAEGTLAFFISAFIVVRLLYPLAPFPVAAAAALGAATVEFFETAFKVDDNLSIPLFSGFILNIFSL